MPRKNIDYTSPDLNPKTLCSWLGIPGNRLGHFVSVTIEAPTEIPRKRGQAGRYSYQDAVLIRLGMKLLNMGITPTRIRACVKVVKAAWESLYPRDLDIDEESWSSPTPTGGAFLVGTESQIFTAQITDYEKLGRLLGIPYRSDALPRLVLNIGLFVAACILSLARHMKRETHKKKA